MGLHHVVLRSSGSSRPDPAANDIGFRCLAKTKDFAVAAVMPPAEEVGRDVSLHFSASLHVAGENLSVHDTPTIKVGFSCCGEFSKISNRSFFKTSSVRPFVTSVRPFVGVAFVCGSVVTPASSAESAGAML